MATLYSPKIVTDGLVMYLDAANPRSYPRSGTAWNDISGNNITGTLTDGPQELYVQKIENNTVTIKAKSAIDCFYLVHATRKDVPMLDTVE